MWWIIRRLHSERGATAVIVGILMVPLIGCLAIAFDVGALYAERAQLQNGADAAALAIAQECAEDDVCNSPNALAAEYTGKNANDEAANVLSVTFPNDHTVTVEDATLTDAGQSAIQHPFAALIGHDSTTVHASATAEWGATSAALIVLPIALSICTFNPALDGTLQLIRYDTNEPCKGPDGNPLPGGFGWLDRLAGGCEAYVNLADASAPSEPGNSYPGACDATMNDLEGKTILIPIFDDADITHHPAKWYHIHAFAAFKVTGWKFAGGNKLPPVNIDPSAPECKGECRGIQGYFDHWVSVDAAAAELGGPDLGAYIVRLTK